MKTISANLSFAERRLLPIDEKTLAVGVDKLVRHARTYNIPCDPKAVSGSWREGTRGMPASLFEEGLTNLLRRWRDTFRLPPPGALWDEIREQHARMTDERNRLETAARFGKPSETVKPEGCVAPEEIDRIVSETLAKLRVA